MRLQAGILKTLCISDTLFGEASTRTQATDPTRRETLRIRTPLPGARGEARWLRGPPPRYAVKCQSSNEGVPGQAVRPGTCSPVTYAHGALARRRQKGGERWTPIVRAENGPSPLLPFC